MPDLDTLEAIARSRRSVRAFLPGPVDRQTIERALAIATTTPSSCNTQPWRLHIASGKAIDRLRVALVEAARTAMPRSADVEYAASYTGIYRQRQIDAAKLLFAAQGIAREDMSGRMASLLRNYAFFGAPHAAFLFLPPGGGLREAADASMFAQTFMLALASAGVGSCPQGSLCDYPAVVREALALEEPGKLLLGISFGYADEGDPTAAVRPGRIGAGDIVKFHED